MNGSIALTAVPSLAHRLRRLFATPKGLFLLGLTLFTFLGAAAQDPDDVIAKVLLGATVAAVIDMAFVAIKRAEIEIPDGSVCTGLLVALILSPIVSSAVIVVATIIAVASKHLVRTRWSNVFNPAAVGLLFAALLFGSAESWWGALPDLGLWGLPVLLSVGLLMTDRINKLPMAAVFLGSFYLFFTTASLLTNWPNLAEVFRAPDLQAVLFFAFFMLDDQPTCPIRYYDQAIYGLIVAFVSYAFFLAFRGDYYLFVGLLAGNAWESARRLYFGRGRQTRTILPLEQT